MTLLLCALLLAAPTPPERDAAIRAYYLQKTNEAAREDITARAAPPGSLETPGAFPRLLGLVRAGSTAPVTEATAGEALVLVGTDLPPDGQVYIAQREATVTRRTATFYELNAPTDLSPADPRPLTGNVDLFVLGRWSGRLYGVMVTLKRAAVAVTIRGSISGSGLAGLRPGTVLQVTGGGIVGTLTVSEVDGQPAPPPTPTLSLLMPILQEVIGGVPERRRAPVAGDTVHIRGHGFGAVRGRVWWGAVEVVPAYWSDTEVRFVMPAMAGGLLPEGIQVSVRTAKGEDMSTGAFIR